MNNKVPIFLLISGPSGSGKTTLTTRLLETYSNVKRIITVTTRQPRPDEIHEKDYYFFSEQVFQQEVEKGNFLEHAKVYGYRYGILKSELINKAKLDNDLVLNTDVQGAQTLREAFGALILPHRLVTIFVAPVSLGELKCRLEKRATEGEDRVRARIRWAADEMSCRHLFDHFLQSRGREEDWCALQDIYKNEKEGFEEQAPS